MAGNIWKMESFVLITFLAVNCVVGQECLLRLSTDPSPSGACLPTNSTSCLSSSVVSAVWHNPPYAVLREHKGSSGEIQGGGLMTFLINDSVITCCQNCAFLSSSPIEVNFDNLTSAASSARFIYPVIGNIETKKMFGINFAPLLEIPGAVLFTLAKGSPSEFARDLLKSVLQIWPLVSIAILLSFVAGVIIWIMDTWFNEQDFPRPFIQGSLEGFWWAFISMTTVGYGDRTPKSYHARLFAMAWILVGITVCSLLTASLTSAITSVIVVRQPKLFGQNVGIFEGHTYEELLAVRKTANITVYNVDQIEVMRSHLKHQVITGVLFDSYTARHYFDYFNEIEDLQVTEVDSNNHHMAYGVLIPHTSDYVYFNKFFENNAERLELATGGIFGDRKIKETVQDQSQHRIYSTKSDMFVPALLASCLTIIIVLVFGMAYELLRRSKDKKQVEPDPDKLKKELERFREEMNRDIEDMLSKWKTCLEAMPKENSRERDMDMIVMR